MQTGRGDAEPVPAAYFAVDSAEFEITSYRGALSLIGHTSSHRHEQRLTLAATELFAEQTPQFTFRALGVAPEWWDEATVALLASLASLDSPSAYLSEDALRVRAIVADKSVAERQLTALREKLPGSADIDVMFTEVDETISATALCARQFAALEVGAVGFEESGTEMRTSAYPVLDRVIALADACRGATISITGHTDSTGNESWNEQLSHARARAVATHLEFRGIDAERLVVVGAGSSEPIADNATRFGRSINRRIEIQLVSTPQ